MLRVDLAAREVRASVRELAAWPPGPPRPGGWFAGARAAHGARLHREYQEEAQRLDPAFRAELSVSYSQEIAGFSLRLHGRADGVRRLSDGTIVVEEIKTTSKEGPADRRQLCFYALCIAAAEPDAQVVARLVRISPEEGGARHVDVPFDPARVRRQLSRLVGRVIRAARREQELRRERATAAERLSFPYPARRAGQQELETAVEEGLGTSRPVLAMAPTGTGKTISALLPALRHALRRDATLFFATSKTSQQKLVARTFLDLDAPGLRACTLRAKARLCPTGTLVCHPENCALLARSGKRGEVEGAVDELLGARRHVAPEDVLALGTERKLCPYVLSLSLADSVDLVIGDYNYLYGPASALERRGREVVAIVDEAHNLFDRVRGHHSVEISRARIVEVQAVAVPGAGRFARRVGALFDDLAAEAEQEHASGYAGYRPLPDRPVAWEELAWEAERQAAVCAASRETLRPDDPLLALLRDILWLSELLAAQEPELIAYTRARGVGVLCVDPSRRLQERHRSLSGTVAVSATLSPLAHYSDVLGLRPHQPLELSLPSPFPAENRLIAIDPSVDTSYRVRDRHYGAIARRIARYVAVKRGHHAAFFPSFAFLEAVRSRLELRDARVVCQAARQSPAESRRILEGLASDRSPTLLMAVSGGTFAEGIDLPGAALVGVIVVGPSLPPVGFERTCMRHHFEATSGDGFLRAMLLPGMQRVIQAAGRVHRRPTDKGTIVLLGRRFATAPYLECLPRFWFAESPEELVHEDPLPLLRAFWC